MTSVLSCGWGMVFGWQGFQRKKVRGRNENLAMCSMSTRSKLLECIKLNDNQIWIKKHNGLVCWPQLAGGYSLVTWHLCRRDRSWPKGEEILIWGLKKHQELPVCSSWTTKLQIQDKKCRTSALTDNKGVWVFTQLGLVNSKSTNWLQDSFIQKCHILWI